MIVANPTMIRRLQGRHSWQRQAVPGRLQDREIQWKPKKSTRRPPFSGECAGHLCGLLFFLIEKDSKRFPDSGGWGYAAV